MPRLPRIKSGNSIYHIMSKSISEIKLLKDEKDKMKYIEVIKYYQKMYKFRIYCYCFMDNHMHLIMDANGADISKIMHGINFTYARYFNKKYERCGHLFHDRFKSKIITSNRYLMTASAYIHNNATDVHGYAKNPEKYGFSSLSAYLGIAEDPFGLVEQDFILSLLGDKIGMARRRYYEMVFKCDSKAKKDIEFEDEGTLSANKRTIVTRNLEAEKIIDYVSQHTNTPKAMLYTKYSKNSGNAKALLVVLLKCACNFNASNICAFIGNITQANVSRLVKKGLKLILENDLYNMAFEGVFSACQASQAEYSCAI